MNDISEFCHSIHYDNLPKQVVDNAKKAIIDTHGVIYAGYKEPVAKVLVEWVQQQSTDAKATVLGHGFQTSESLAALLNGAMGHALDFDDVYSGLRGHPSIPVYAAVLAVCEAENKSGKDVITAFCVGVEVMAKLGAYMNPAHVVTGWHSTATLGVLGVSAAIGKLYGFNQSQYKHVLGLASSMMSGLMINFGTMTKPFHAGYCAKNGIEAAQLVNKGLTACEDSFTPKTGVFDLYTDEEMQSDWGSDFGQPWSIVDPGFNIKRYPCCYATHRFADAAYKMQNEHAIDPHDITSIECVAAVGSYAPVIHHRPQSGLHAKFSLEYVVAAMLVDQKVSMDSFTDDMVNRPTIQQLIPKVILSEDQSIIENRATNDTGYIQLTIKTNGKTFTEKVVHAKGSSRNPIDIHEVKEKFIDCFEYTGQSERSHALYAALFELEKAENLERILR